MNIYRYTTAGGKDVIGTYIKSLPKKVQYEYNSILELLEEEGMDAFQVLEPNYFRDKLEK